MRFAAGEHKAAHWGSAIQGRIFGSEGRYRVSRKKMLTMTTKRAHEPHLVIKDRVLPPGHEWEPRMSGWLLIQVRSGSAYWLHDGVNQELPTASVLLQANPAVGRIRASPLGSAAFH